jgi:hypothetical protein
MFAAKLATLPAAQQSLWPKLSFAKNLGFTLYGGTAIAIQLGHRISIDFDFFSTEPLNKSQLFQAAPFLQNATVIQDEVNSLTLLVTEPDTAESTPLRSSTHYRRQCTAGCISQRFISHQTQSNTSTRRGERLY